MSEFNLEDVPEQDITHFPEDENPEELVGEEVPE